MDKPARVAIVGCGAIAYEHLAFLAKDPKVELAAVCDRSEVTARFIRDRFEAGQPFTDAAVMLDAVKPDFVHVLTPPSSHEALVRLALGAGAHVICEKPMTGNAPATESLLAAAKGAGRWLIESRNLLWNDEVVRAKREAANGNLGDVREVEVSISLDILSGPFGDLNLEGPGVDLPAGAIHDFLPHMTYLFLDLLGVQPEDVAVAGTLANLSGNCRAGYDFLDCLLSAGDRRGRLRFAADIKPASFRVTLRGTQGVLETDIYHSFVRLQTEAWSGKRAPFEAMGAGFGLFKSGMLDFRNKVLQHNSYHGLRRMLDAVYSAYHAKSPPPVSTDEILATARLIDKIVALRRAA